MTDRYIRDMHITDLMDVLVGRTVTEVNPDRGTLTLDNGIEVEFEDTADCCAWFSYELKAGNLTDNAITSVTGTDNSDGDDDEVEDYTIHILAANKNVADLTITGDPTSGYYCHSINMTITSKGNTDD